MYILERHYIVLGKQEAVSHAFKWMQSRVSRFLQIKLYVLSLDAQLVSEQSLVQPFFDLKHSRGTMAN